MGEEVKLESKFEIGDKVKIKETEHSGRIMSVWWTAIGAQLEVRYFHEGKINKEYFFEDEIEKRERNETKNANNLYE